MRHPWRDRIISFRRGESALRELRIIVAMDQVMNDAGMIGVLFPELFQDGGCLKLFRQTSVVERGITNSEYREGMEGLHFEIVRILVAQLAHRFFVRDYRIARPDWPMTRLPDGGCARTVRRMVIDIQRRDKSALAICAGIHYHPFFNSRFARAHFVRGRWRPNRMPPGHGDSPLRHRAFRVALGYSCKNAPRLFVKEWMQQRDA